jgi:heme/copper-type cytochrome/quinol oxidase subunit 2
MKKYFVSVTILFIGVFMSPYCFAVNPIVGKQHHESVESEGFKLSGRVENGTRIIEIKASRYKFEPDPIVVKLGEKVELALTSTDVTHGLAIPEFNVNVVAAAGQTKTVEFIADRRGNFHAHCNVYCGPGHVQMHASFIVE